MVNARDVAAQSVLAVGGNPLFHFRSAQAGILPDHGDDRNVDFRKDIGAHGLNGGYAKEQNEKDDDIKSVWPS